MSERIPFEYAVLRVVPRVERGESINAGVIVYSQAGDYLGARVHLDVERLRALDPNADVDRDRGRAAIGRRDRATATGRPAARRSDDGSAGSPRRAARSCSRARCTPG